MVARPSHESDPPRKIAHRPLMSLWHIKRQTILLRNDGAHLNARFRTAHFIFNRMNSVHRQMCGELQPDGSLVVEGDNVASWRETWIGRRLLFAHVIR